jgi:hypothetical protein
VTDADLEAWIQAPFVDPPQVILQRLRDDGEIMKDEIVQNHTEIRSLQARLKAKETEVITRNAELNLQMPLAKLLVQEIDAYRNRRMIRMIERFIDRVDYSSQLAPAYRQIRDDSLIFFQPLKGYRLRLSQNLQRVPHLAYPVQLPRTGLNRLSFAAVIDLYPRQGMVGVEVIGNGKVMASATLPAHNIRADEPLAFDFHPMVHKAGETLEMRLFARDLDVPLRIYEWHHYSYFGLGNPQIKPFCSFDFHTEK